RPMSNLKYVGMDVHKAITVIVVLNALGQIESRSQVKTKAATICDFFRGLSGKVAVIFEEGTYSAWFYQLLKPLVASITTRNSNRCSKARRWRLCVINKLRTTTNA